ncbi:hypothetical protein PHET_11963 [Paragonimus heterotremus]|uniref:Uncharacterized protein n=1 Tax=Paragonimus heterotremus TaxID=100268 RepID=A0A8J4WS89_9TREM|nr:hypothetical protein PHET_11963 [Paragonimus heterotremus]
MFLIWRKIHVFNQKHYHLENWLEEYPL